VPAPTLLRNELSVEPVVEMPLSEAMPLMKEIYARVRPSFVGHLNRTDAIWTSLHNDHPFTKKGNPRRVAVHTDGYIVYRLTDSWTERGPDYTLTVVELCAGTPAARASLWQHVLRYPLIRKVVFRKAWEDEPLAEMLDNPRIIKSELGDHVWTRLVDLPRAVEQRAFSATADVVVKVSDRFCPWNDDTWHLHLSNNGGSATASLDQAVIELDIVDLGAAFLGGTRITRLAAAGRVTGTQEAIDELDAAMGTPLRPWTPEGF
jgi:predicted acetyltransferase